MTERKKRESGKGAVELSEEDLAKTRGGADAFKSPDSTDSTEAQPGRLKWGDITLKRGW